MRAHTHTHTHNNETCLCTRPLLVVTRIRAAHGRIRTTHSNLHKGTTHTTYTKELHLYTCDLRSPAHTQEPHVHPHELHSPTHTQTRTTYELGTQTFTRELHIYRNYVLQHIQVLRMHTYAYIHSNLHKRTAPAHEQCTRQRTIHARSPRPTEPQPTEDVKKPDPSPGSLCLPLSCNMGIVWVPATCMWSLCYKRLLDAGGGKVICRKKCIFFVWTRWFSGSME